MVSRSYTGGSFQLEPGPHRLEVWMSWLAFPHAHAASCAIEIEPQQTVGVSYHSATRRGGPGRIELAGVPTASVHR